MLSQTALRRLAESYDHSDTDALGVESQVKREDKKERLLEEPKIRRLKAKLWSTCQFTTGSIPLTSASLAWVHLHCHFKHCGSRMSPGCYLQIQSSFRTKQKR